MAKKGSKNNIENRGAAAKLKEYNGEKVVPVMYNGNSVGHGNYMAGLYEDSKKLVLDHNKQPIPYHKINC